MTRESLLETQAREMLGMPSEWQWMVLENVRTGVGLGGGAFVGVRITGAVVPVNYKSGKLKGMPNFAKRDTATERTVFITVAQCDAWEAAWVQRTGLCPGCVGEGTRPWRTSREGTEYRPCGDCGGTGKAAAKGVANA